MNRSLLKLLALLLLLSVPAAAVRAAKNEPLVPADYQEHQDSLGFGWHVFQGGGLANDGRGCFNSAEMLMSGGMQANFSQQMMTPDSSEYFFSGWQIQGVEVSRTVRLDLKQGLVQYIESFRNPSKTPVTVNFNLQTQMMNRGQACVTDQGTPLGTALSPKDVGFVCNNRQANMPSVLFYFGNAKSKVRPTIQARLNHQFTISYLLTVPPGETASVVHGVAQRSMTGAPDAKALAALFKPFKEESWLRGVPTNVRRTIVNAPSSGFSFGALGEAGDALAELGTRSAHDMLLIGEDTRLRGTLTCKELSIVTQRGKQKVPLDRVAAIIGGKQRNQTMRLVLRDGQVFVGPVTATELKFTLNSGLDVTCDLTRLDRFVLREQPGDGQPVAEVFAYLDMPGGDRLAVRQGGPQKLTVQTAWGQQQIPLEEIQQWSMLSSSEGQAGHRIVLRDGSAFAAFLGDVSLKLITTHHGPQEFAALEILRLRAAGSRPDKEQSAALSVPHAVLLGENRFVGQLEQSLLHLVSQGQVIPVAPPQIKLLRRTETTEVDNLLFQAELWDGDTVVGLLRENELSLRTTGGLMSVPVDDLVELRVPTPTVPESLRARITELLADLGNPEWTRREAASKELAELGAVGIEQFQETLKETTDSEVRKRVQALLDAVKE